jgi:hypothetical protein
VPLADGWKGDVVPTAFEMIATTIETKRRAARESFA